MAEKTINTDVFHGQFLERFTKDGRRIYGYIVTLLPNWADVDDVFQDTSRVLWEKFAEFEPGTDFFAWACRVAQYEVMSFRKRQQRSKLIFSDDFLRTVAELAERRADLLNAQHQALLDCLSRLKDNERQLIRRRYAPGETTKSVAKALGRSRDAIYKAIARIQDKLLDCVRRESAKESRTG